MAVSVSLESWFPPYRNSGFHWRIQGELSAGIFSYDNARMESFFAMLKKELLYRIPAYRMAMGEVKTLVFRYVFIYYNQYRIYTSNPGGQPPAAFRISALGYAA